MNSPPEFDSWNLEDYRLTSVCTHENGKLFGPVCLRTPEELLEDKIAMPDAANRLFPPQLEEYQGLVGRWDDLGDDGSVAVWFEEVERGELFPVEALRNLIDKDTKPDFEVGHWLKMLAALAKAPDSQIATALSKQMGDFIKEEHTPVEVWNFYKEMLDMAVRYAGASTFVMWVINLEPFYNPPNGDAYLQSDGSINNAPWRQL